MLKIGIIGGSGLEKLDVFKIQKELDLDTPYGKPTSTLRVGLINDVEIVLLSRHGYEHTITPTKVNFRANIWALKDYGCKIILGTTAVGSLREEIKPGDLVILDQFIDFTKHRLSSYYEEFEPHRPIHVSLAEPFDKKLRDKFIVACEKLNLSYHKIGTVVTIEGPRFSTKAESKMYQQWGADVINMTTAPEAILAKEAGVPYAAVAMSTDYDCWRENEEPVTWEKVLEIFAQNIKKVTDLLVETVKSLKE